MAIELGRRLRESRRDFRDTPLNSSFAGMEQATQLLLEPGREWLREMASRDQL